MELYRGAGAVLTTITTVAITGSTNADLLALANAGIEDAIWLRAERQTAGRGRQGREWSSPTGNLYASTLVRLRPGDPPATALSLVAGVALHEAVSVYARDITGASLKWPNDLLCGGAKLAGILLERTGDAVVAGFGVNVAQTPEDTGRPVTSLAEFGVTVSASELLSTLTECFERWLRRWRGEGCDVIHRAWSERAHPHGTPLGFHDAGGRRVEALFAGLTGEGAARLRLADGSVHVMHAGDLFAL